MSCRNHYYQWNIEVFTKSQPLSSSLPSCLPPSCSLFSFPSTPSPANHLPEIMQIFLLKTCCIQNLRPSILPSFRLSIPLSLPKNGWPQLHLEKQYFTACYTRSFFSLSLCLFRIIKGWPDREVWCARFKGMFLVSLLAFVYLCQYVSVYWPACVSVFWCFSLCVYIYMPRGQDMCKIMQRGGCGFCIMGWN